MSASTEPQPRRDRKGRVLIGPPLSARALPLIAIGLPMLSVLLCTFPATAVQQWRKAQIRAGQQGLLIDLLEPAVAQLVTGALLLWIASSLASLAVMAATRRYASLDCERHTVTVHDGLRTRTEAPLSNIAFVRGEPERIGSGFIGVWEDPSGPGQEATPSTGDPRGSATTWVIPFVGWDDASFEGLRALQIAAGITPQPPRPQVEAMTRHHRTVRMNRELAARIEMPWRPEYEADPAAFQRDFDAERRRLLSKPAD